MTENLTDFANRLHEPEHYWKKAVALTAEDDDNLLELINPLPEATNYSMFRQSDGAGNEAVLLVRRSESEEIEAALLLAYDHESSFAASIAHPEEAADQPALKGLPYAEFAPALHEGSPLFWDYKDYPATSDHVFASAAIWYLNGKWSHADISNATDFKGTPIDEARMVRQIKGLLKEFQFGDSEG